MEAWTEKVTKWLTTLDSFLARWIKVLFPDVLTKLKELEADEIVGSFEHDFLWRITDFHARIEKLLQEKKLVA